MNIWRRRLGFLPYQFPGYAGVCGLSDTHPRLAVELQILVRHVCHFWMMKAGGNCAHFGVFAGQAGLLPGRASVGGNRNPLLGGGIDSRVLSGTKAKRDVRGLSWKREAVH